jgi:hypothetical protein
LLTHERFREKRLMQRHSALFIISSVLVGLVGCGEAQDSRAQASLHEGLQVSPNAWVTSATYTLSGPNGFVSAGSVAVGDSADVSIELGGLPVGAAYEISVSATATDGLTMCNGNKTFDVTSGNTTVTEVVHLDCSVPTGDVSVNGSINTCPVLDDLTASPLALSVGGVSTLTASAHDPDNGPQTLNYSWFVNDVHLPKQTAPSLNFACSSPGDLTIGVSVSDGDPNCATTANVKVSCE